MFLGIEIFGGFRHYASNARARTLRYCQWHVLRVWLVNMKEIGNGCRNSGERPQSMDFGCSTR